MLDVSLHAKKMNPGDLIQFVALEPFVCVEFHARAVSSSGERIWRITHRIRGLLLREASLLLPRVQPTGLPLFGWTLGDVLRKGRSRDDFFPPNCCTMVGP